MQRHRDRGRDGETETETQRQRERRTDRRRDTETGRGSGGQTDPSPQTFPEASGAEMPHRRTRLRGWGDVAEIFLWGGPKMRYVRAALAVKMLCGKAFIAVAKWV